MLSWGGMWMQPVVEELVTKVEKLVGPREPWQRKEGELLAAFRRMIATDPDKLPVMELYSIRVFAATRLWKWGVSSAWLMSFMHHLDWRTTRKYLAVEGPVKWREEPRLVCTEDELRWVHVAARTAPLVQEPSALRRWIWKSRRKDYLKAVEVAADLELGDLPTTEEEDLD